ncbi:MULTISPECIES: prepilin-type cleavage/methylation domain-containing protein [Clostridium]|uniref:type II secretion system protein n=1 Tax=Clostridium TaxID=1485 RepID=UPI001897BD92|nr:MULTISPECIES: prepilin-type cleavage/methylation domain-containing protein [Clostridium]MCR1949737.1 prepilin-type cleavage/methylation domain-containing protein [Clostridium sp. DSM 100503]MDI9216121.1 prepilin-type cleavage/methylation domain-containing protein [Clostridium tertium]
MKENLLNLIGWKRSKSNKRKRCFTLIELILVMFIQLILLSLSFKIALTANKNYTKLIKDALSQDSFDDAILNIDRLLKTQMVKSIEIQESDLNNNAMIKITYKIDHNKNEVKDKRIFLDNVNRKIVLETYKDGKRKGINIIMREVSSFIITKKEKIYYLKINSLSGEERVICI